MKESLSIYTRKIFRHQPYTFLFIYSFILMLFFTQTSPFFVLTEWVDSNAFFTVGKGMANGLVPYRDLFEQKGPLLYALHALAYSLSHTTFRGVYILESLAMFINLIFAFKISRLYLNWMPAVIISILFPLFLLNQSSFRYGDSAEEFSIPFLLALLYILFKKYQSAGVSSFSWPVYLVNGILVGCVFWIKFTLVGPWIGFYLAMLFISLGNKRWKELGSAIVFTAAGLALSSLPWLIYFGINHAINDLINVYITFNFTAYPSQNSIGEKLVNSAFIFGNALRANFECKLMLIIGMVGFGFTWKYFKDKNQKWLFLSTVLFLILGVYFGGRSSPYYFLFITPLALFGMIVIGNFIQNSHLPSQVSRYHYNRWLVLPGVAATTIFLCFGYNFNIQASKLYNNQPLVQQTFAKIIRQVPHATLLNYGSLDGGFYFAANILPTVRYFESQNVDYSVYPENMDEQNRYIKEGKVTFVVARVPANTLPFHVHIPYLKEHYHLVSQQVQNVEGIPWRFLLYKKNH